MNKEIHIVPQPQEQVLIATILPSPDLAVENREEHMREARLRERWEVWAEEIRGSMDIVPRYEDAARDALYIVPRIDNIIEFPGK